MSTITLSRFPLQTTPAPGTTKVCKGCPDKGNQPLDKFNKNYRYKDGHRPICKDCEARIREEKKKEMELYRIA